MSNADIKTVPSNAPAESGDQKKNLFAAGGVIGALLASACCIAPLVLLTVGISGAWISTLTALEPYRPIFASIALVFIGLGFRQVYFKARPTCVEGTYCAKPESARIIKAVLWLATLLVILALTINWWAPLFY